METHKIGILIKMASVEFEKDAATILKHYDLTPSQFKILRYVNHFKEKRSGKSILNIPLTCQIPLSLESFKIWKKRIYQATSKSRR